MTIPNLTPLPPYPSRTASPEAWVAQADAFVAAEFNFVNVDMNTQVIPGMNQAVVDVNAGVVATDANVTAAEASALASSSSASASEASSVTSLSHANDSLAFKNAAALSESNALTSANNSEASNLASAASALASSNSAGASAASAVTSEYWAGQAEATVVADVIADTAVSSFQVRSSLNDSIGNFENVNVAVSATITALQHGRITAAGAGVVVTIPNAPLEGQMVMVSNLTSRLDHTIAVGSNKVKGQDPVGTLNIDRANITITLKYINAAYGWEVMQ